MRFVYIIFVLLTLNSCSQRSSEAADSTREQQIAVAEGGKGDFIRSEAKYKLGDLQVAIQQVKGDGTDFYCQAKIVTSRRRKLLDSLSFSPEPVGGQYGISKAYRVGDHLVFTKYGDYDGRTIVINKEGEIFNLIGGKNYYDMANQQLFSVYVSDVNGFAVFDFSTDTVIFEMLRIDVEPVSFHKAFGERYFILGLNIEGGQENQSVWEIEADLERIMQVDLDTSQINDSTVLRSMKIEGVYCECTETE